MALVRAEEAARIDAARQSDNFSFKCHRADPIIHCVNSIAFNQKYGTFATAGSDGRFVFWDKNERNRLKQFIQEKGKASIVIPAPCPITASAWNADSTLFAYAHGYDWSKGHAHAPAAGTPPLTQGA